jgi:hypothetical protein
MRGARLLCGVIAAAVVPLVPIQAAQLPHASALHIEAWDAVCVVTPLLPQRLRLLDLNFGSCETGGVRRR